MAKENETIRNKETGSVNLGSVKIADDVVASIAAIAACEVDGVKRIDGTASENLFSKVGIRGVTRGAKVEVNGKQVRAAVAIIMDYGYNIPETCQYVQKRVKNSIENMTGLEVVDVNIRIAGINVEG